MKRTISEKLYKPALLFLLMLMPIAGVAQDEDTEFEDDVNDEVVEAPINGYTGLALIAGCALGYMLLKRETKVS